METFPAWYPEWSLSFDLYPLGPVDARGSILRLKSNGARNPFFFFRNGSLDLTVVADIDGVRTSTSAGVMPINQWTTISTSQKYIQDDWNYVVEINHTTIFTTTNQKPEIFPDANLYAAAYNTVANAWVKNIIAETANTGLSRALTQGYYIIFK